MHHRGVLKTVDGDDVYLKVHFCACGAEWTAPLHAMAKSQLQHWRQMSRKYLRRLADNHQDS